MSNQVIRILTIVVIVAMSFLLLFNLKKWLPGGTSEPYLQSKTVTSITIVEEGKEYPVATGALPNFIGYINHSVPVEGIRKEGKKEKPRFEKIVIVRKEDVDAIITPILYVDDNLIFSAPQWNPHGYMLDLSDGYLQELILKTTQQRSDASSANM